MFIDVGRFSNIYVFDGHTKKTETLLCGSKHYESLIATAGYSI